MPTIIPLFIPHEGCPHACSYCNQFHTRPLDRPGQPHHTRLTPQEIHLHIETWLARLRPQRKKLVQVAFYGGSFTALSQKRQVELLTAVQPYLKAGLVHGIRLSTRPDYIEQDQLHLLRQHGVCLIELGVQSCDDSVLARARRGHSHADSLRASACIRASGLQLGWQLMVGMPGESFAGIRRMTAACIREQPNCIRIYPLVVLRGSALEKEWRGGGFQPLSLPKAVLFTAYMKKRFDAHGLAVIRMGLQPSLELEQNILAGPYHPAFGEQVAARLMLKKTRKLLSRHRGPEPCILRIAPGDMSIFTGIRRANLKRLEALGLRSRFILRTDACLPRQSLQMQVLSSHNTT